MQLLLSSALQNCASNWQLYVAFTANAAGRAPAPVDPESVPRPDEPLATPQVVPRIWVDPFMPELFAQLVFVHFVRSPYGESLSADSVSASSSALVFLTSTLYLTVA